MTWFLFITGFFQCCLIWLLGRRGFFIAMAAQKDHELAVVPPPEGWPSCALIVPVSGAHPAMEAALSSLALQNYPNLAIYLVTASREDPAFQMVSRMARAYPRIKPVIAGMAESCGQKNLAQLAGVASAGDSADIYAFCDSTHIAQPDFLCCLVGPIARNQAAFTTGYHEVEPRDGSIISLAYALCAMFMRFLQAMPGLTQPWGGAMAMSRKAFIRAGVADLWRGNVVDDCSLAAMLRTDGIKVRLCPGATLRTWVSNHSFAVWRSWLERQILFLKFCMPGQWLLLGLVCLLMTAPSVWAIWACLEGIMGQGGNTGPFLALCWFCLLGWVLTGWRRYLPAPTAISRWLVAFFCATFVFALVYICTLGSHTLLWNNILYKVGKGGKVISLERL